ncbi:hypothetical protein [Streptomyces ardesiacus]
MSPNPFPEISSGEELDDVWAGDYVECVGCVDMVPVKPGMDPVEWAKGHTAERPGHTRYRTTRIVNFSVTTPKGPAGFPSGLFPARGGTCGASRTLPDEEKPPQATRSGCWDDVTVVCAAQHSEPAEAVVHAGPIVVEGERRGVHYWGPGYPLLAP